MSEAYVRGSDLVWRRVGDSVLIRTLGGRLSTLQGTGVLLWEELAAPTSFEGVAERVRARFPDAGEQLGTDVRAALAALVAEGLVEGR